MTVTRSSSMFETITLGDTITDIQVPLTDNLTVKMGDDAGANKVSFTDSGNAEVAYIDSNGFLSAVGVTVGGVALKTTADINWYIATTGNDTTGDGTVGSPWLTRQKAYDSIPDVVAHKVTINIATGTYYDAGVLSGRYISTNGAVTVQGATTTILASQTATSGDDINANGLGEITVAAAGWVVNAYQGNWVRFTTTTSPTASVYEKYVKIISNDATTLVTPALRFTPDGNTTFDIVSLDTIISGATVGTPNVVDHVPETNSNMQVATDAWYDGLYYRKPVTYDALNIVNGSGMNVSISQTNSLLTGIHFGLTDPAAFSYHYGIWAFTAASYIKLSGIYVDGYSQTILLTQENAIADVQNIFADYTATAAGVTEAFSDTTGSSIYLKDFYVLGDVTHPVTYLINATGNGSMCSVSKGRVVYATYVMGASSGATTGSAYNDTIFGANNGTLFRVRTAASALARSQINAGVTNIYEVDDASMISRLGTSDYYAIDHITKNITGIVAGSTIPLGYSHVKLSAVAPTVLTSTPTIANGIYQGQKMVIRGTDDTNTITLQDSNVLVGSTLELLNNNVVGLGAADRVEFSWNAVASKWEESGNIFMNMMFHGTTGNKNIYIEDNQADTLSFTEGANKYLTFKTTNGSEAVQFPILATGQIFIDAGTVDHTGASVMSFDVDANSASVNALNFDIDVGTALSGGEIVNGINIDIDGLAGDNAASNINGINLTSTNATGGINSAINIAGAWDYGIYTVADIYGIFNRAFKIQVDNQPSTGNANGVGLTIQADQGGTLAAGASNGGNIAITAGAAGGATGNGNGGITNLLGGAKINAGTTGYVRVGTGAPTSIASFDVNSLYVSGAFEANNVSRFNSTATFASASVHKDGISAIFGDGSDAVILYSTAQTPDSWLFGVSADSRTLMVVEKADTATDFALALQANPTIAIQSSDATKVYEGALYTYSGIAQRVIGNILASGTDFTIQGQDAGTNTTGGRGGAINLYAGDAQGSGANNGGSVLVDLGVKTGAGVNGAFTVSLATAPIFSVTTLGASVAVSKIIQGSQGTDLASANDMAVPTSNYCDVTGNTQINTMAAIGLQAGTMVVLQFDSNPLVKQATAGAGAQFQLSGGIDFSATAGDTLMIVYDGTFWREVSRTVI